MYLYSVQNPVSWIGLVYTVQFELMSLQIFIYKIELLNLTISVKFFSNIFDNNGIEVSVSTIGGPRI